MGLLRSWLPTATLGLAVAAASSGCTARSSEAANPAPSTSAPATLAPEGPAAVPQPGEAWIAYQKDDAPGGPRIALVRPDGTGDHVLVEQDTEHQTNPDWSPDGEQLTFVASDGRRDDLYVVHADGTGLRLLLDCRGTCALLDDPAWSPDGRSIAVSRSDRDGLSTLQVVSVRSGLATTLWGPRSRQATSGVRWSPDGRRLVLEIVDKDGPGLEADVTGVTLMVMEADDLRVARAVSDPTVFAATADWSSDGRWIVYSALPSPSATGADLFAVRPDGTDQRRLTRLVREGGEATEPTWVPLSRAVLFVGPGSELLRVSSAGAVRVAADPDLVIRHPRWRPGTRARSAGG